MDERGDSRRRGIDLAFIAMSQYQLGSVKIAKEILLEARSIAEKLENTTLWTFVKEAEELIEGSEVGGLK